MKQSRFLLSLIALAICALLFSLVPGCSNSNSDDSNTTDSETYSPVPGDKLEKTLTETDEEGNVKLLHKQVNAYYQIDKYGNLTIYEDGKNYVLIQESEEYYDEEFEKIQNPRGRMARELVTPEFVEKFIQDEWDEYIGGMSDEGANVEEFMSELQSAAGGDLQTYLYLYNTSGMSLAEFEKTMNTVQNVPGQMPAEELLAFLDNTEMELKDLKEQLVSIGSTPEKFFISMANQNIGFTELYNLYKAGQWESFGAFLQAVLNGTVKTVKGDSEPTALSVAKFAWDIIKDTKPEVNTSGAQTAILSSRDTDPMNYANAQEVETSLYTCEGKNLFNMTLYKATFKLAGTCKAKHRNFYGNWMPTVFFQFTECYAGWTWRLNGTASVTQVSNIGGYLDDASNPPNPMIYVIANISENGLFQACSDSYTFQATGAGDWKKK